MPIPERFLNRLRQGFPTLLPTLALHFFATVALLAVASAASIASAQQIDISRQIWSADVIRARGQAVIPLFDGWFPNDDGSRSLCYSFFNLNSEQALTIPLGKDNYLSDDRFNVLLPTHFDPLPPRYRHKFCVFTITVPADFPVGETVVWHLSSAGQSLSIPGHILPAYILDEPASLGRGNLAPLVKFARDDEGFRGRKGRYNESILKGEAGRPVDLGAWIEHPDEEVWVGWAKHSGPGAVEFSELEYTITPNQGATEVQATFSQAGRYIIRLQTIDSIAAFEFYCCHTNAYYTVDIGS